MNPQIIFETKNIKRYKFPTHINDLIVDRTRASFCEVFMVEVEPGKSVPHHKHDDTEQIFYVIKGAGILSFGENKEEFPIKPGDVIRIPVAHYHSIRNDYETTLAYLSVDCFGAKKPDEDSWDNHVKVMCETHGWDYEKVISSGPAPSPENLSL